MKQSQHQTAQLIFDRITTVSAPGHRKDGRRVALVIEGGGMRGVVSGGMVAGLEELGLLQAFDVVYGSSAGSISGAYFIARQARYGNTIFYQNINNRKFLNIWRIFCGKPAMSLEFLLNRVCQQEKPLFADRVIHSPIPLKVVCSSISLKQSVALSDFTSQQELFQALRCSARIPFFAGGPVAFRGDHYFDASIYQSIPLRAAIADRATDIVVLLSRPRGKLRGKPNWIDRHIIAPYLTRIDAELKDHYLQRAARYKSELEEIYALSNGAQAVHTLPIQMAEDAPNVSPFETGRHKLLSAAMHGFRAVYVAFGLPAPDLVEIIGVRDTSSG